MPYRYYLLNRPPSIGTHPKGGTRSRAWDYRTLIRPEDLHINPRRKAWGWVEYDTPLTSKQAWKYDLLPANRQEQANYIFLAECSGDTACADAVKKRYTAITIDRLELLAKDLPIAQAAIILAEEL